MSKPVCPTTAYMFDIDQALADLDIPVKNNPETRENMMLGSGVIRNILGEGGMSVVYEIWNEKLAIKRAVKVLRPESSRENRNRFETEIKVTAQLDHPNVVRIHSVGEWKGMPYIEMEMVDGCSLAAMLKDYGALPFNITLSIALIVSRALSYTHTVEYSIFGETGTGILHRDLKPENILISRKGTVKLTDFGIATPVQVSMHTPDGSIVGSLQYMAPEQLNEQAADERSDIFSFGCVLYEMLVGMKMFPHRNIAILSKSRLAHDYEPLATFKTDAPARVINLVNRCLELQPQKRPANMASVAAELGNIHKALFDESPERILESFVKRERKTVKILAIRHTSKSKPTRVAAGVVLGCLIGAGVMWASLSPTVREKLAGLQRILADKTQFHAAYAAVTPSPAATQPQLSIPQEPSGESQKADPLLTVLSQKYGTDDILALMKGEDAAASHQNVIELFNSLSPVRARSVAAVVLKMRALKATDQLTLDFLDHFEVKDAEFFLTKAQYLCSRERYTAAIRTLDKMNGVPAALAPVDDLKRAGAYCRAQCLDAQFRNRPDSNLETLAVAAWQAVKDAFAEDQGAEPYRKACAALEMFGGS